MPAMISISPSRSRSTGQISLGALMPEFTTVLSVKLWDPLFSYQNIASPSNAATMKSISLSKSRSIVLTLSPPLGVAIWLAVNDGVAFEMLVGVALAKVAEPPLMENAKSPTSNAPLPEFVSYTSSLSFTVTVLLSLATLVPETIVGAVASYLQ